MNQRKLMKINILAFVLIFFSLLSSLAVGKTQVDNADVYAVSTICREMSLDIMPYTRFHS